MRGSDRHPSDAELRLRAEGEPPDRRTREQLAGCPERQARPARTEDALEDFFAVRRRILDRTVPAPGPARERLRSALAQGAGSVTRAPSHLPAALAAAALALAAATGAVLWHDGDNALARDSLAAAGAVPDPAMTPGATGAAGLAELCAPAKPVVPAAIDREMALRIFRNHGIANPEPLAYELDHLVPPELGGITAAENLWPQAYRGTVWNAHAKDALEDRLLRRACSGEVSLQAAQNDIARHWVDAYRKHFRTAEPLVEHAAFLKDRPWQ